MTPKLTSEQREALVRGNGPVLVEDEQTNRQYYLVDAATFQGLQQQEDLAAIRDGIADMEAGRVVTLDELDARIRARLAAANPKLKSRGPFTVLPLV
jgi:predicted transcriptional regulator